MIWLFKEEPTHYSYFDLEKDGSTAWSGVKNPLAQKHLRAVKRGDRILYYHTGKEKAIVGVARAACHAYRDPKDRAGRQYVVDVEPVRRLDQRPAPLRLVSARAYLPPLRDAGVCPGVGRDREDGQEPARALTRRRTR